jgi:DNA invertase Pin-like site-specific DNA recombinase
VFGYTRVSTSDQADSGAGLEAQRTAIRLACEQRGWELVGVVEDAGFSAATLARPGIAQAFDLVESGGASVLVVAKLDRLSRRCAPAGTNVASRSRVLRRQGRCHEPSARHAGG